MRMKLCSIAGLVFGLLLPACQISGPSPAATADTVLVNGKILTVDAEFSIAQALAIRGGRIVAVGANDALRELIGSSTKLIDLAGRTVIPGLIDNHMHFIRAVERWNLQARIDGINSRSKALAVIAAKAAGMAAGEWLMVQGGWWESQFADQPGGFTLEELDRAAPKNPLFLQVSYRTVYANTLALRAVGRDPANGARYDKPPMISFDPPYGILNAQMPKVSPTQVERNLADFMHALNKSGLTSVYDVGRPPEGDIALVEKLARRSPLPLRVWHTLRYEAKDPAGADAAAELVRQTTPDTSTDQYGMIGLGEHIYLPMFDLPERTAPYPANVGAEFMKIARVAAERGFNIQEHTMTEWTIKDLLERFEVLNRSVPITRLRWNLAHVYTITPQSVQRAKAMGMTLGVHSVAMYSQSKVLPPIRTIQDSGIVWGLGTDSTIVAHYQPFITLWWAVTGKALHGGKVLAQTVTREEALIAHTRSNAYVLFKENLIGTLETGKLADLVVLDRDYMTIPADDIVNISPVLTMVGGRTVFDKNEVRTAQR
ncbi:MAG: amidohydrolase family protein [Betaproteobacteria bacterium]|nr:amidohydrolase family protein [Betaproteobacteria bacterium]